MTYETIKDIITNMPDSAIVHIKTKNGDKICIKDNSRSTSSKISCITKPDCLEIISKTQSDKKVSESITYLPFDSIVQIDIIATTSLIEDSRTMHFNV